MTEISCRAFSYFTVAEGRGLLDVSRLLEGLPIERASLEDSSQRVSWDLWAQLCDRAAEQLGEDPTRLAESGALIADTGATGFVGYLAPIAALFGSTEDLFDVVVRWGGPSLYRSHEFTLAHLPRHQMRMTVALKPGYRPCLAWFQMASGALRVLPRLVGQVEAVVETESISPTAATFLISPPANRTLQALARRTWAALRSPRAVSNELAFQQMQLARTIDVLRRTEGGFRSAFDALPTYVILHRASGIVYANPALARAVGRSEEALLRLPLGELVHVDDRDRFARELLAPPDAGRTRAVVRLLTGGAATRTVEIATLPPFDFGGARTAGVIAIDVTERLRVEETLSLLQASLPDLVLRIAADGCLLDVQGGVELTVQTEFLRAHIGVSDWEAALAMPGTVSEHLARSRRALATALETGAEQRIELIAELDVERTFEVRVVPRAGGGEVLMLIRDLTAQRTAERQLAISERMASVGTLAAGVAHEINNPLTYVMAGHDELDHELAALERGEPVDTAGLRSLLAEGREGVARIRDIVASLRTFSRIEVGAATVRLDPREAIQRALAMCAGELRHRAALEVDLGQTPFVHADPSALIQVLLNLLLNAAQAMPEDLRTTRRIRVVSGTDEDGRVRIEVHDTGVGIAPHHLRRIFDPFFTTKPVNEGTGLGLSISHRLVNDLGGTITVASELGKGSVFVVNLPAALPEGATPASSRTPSSESHGRVLIIDDEPMVAAAIARALSREGHTCTTASSAKAALALLEEQPFDLVLCDLMMPGTSGMELYAQVRAIEPEIAERFVFITGGAFTDAARALIEEGPRPVLAKPPDVKALRLHMAEALLRRSKDPT